MKKFIPAVLVLVIAVSMFAGCTKNEEAKQLSCTLEEAVAKIYEVNPVEFSPATIPLDLTDTSEDGQGTVNYYTGLDNANMISEAVVSEAMIGSIPYSLVLVRVTDTANTQNVAKAMKSGIDTRKWVCVEADDLQVSGFGDVVMLVMIGSEYGKAQSFTDAFKNVCGSDLDFTI